MQLQRLCEECGLWAAAEATSMQSKAAALLEVVLLSQQQQQQQGKEVGRMPVGEGWPSLGPRPVDRQEAVLASAASADIKCSTASEAVEEMPGSWGWASSDPRRRDLEASDGLWRRAAKAVSPREVRKVWGRWGQMAWDVRL